MKELLVYQGPVSSRSGYGDHARDVLRSFIKMDRFDIKVVDTPWGSCPRNALDVEKDKDISERFLNYQLNKKPDVFVQVTIPSEFIQMGEFNIGITAGIETTLVHQNWLVGMNKMDLNLVPSKHAKDVFESTTYEMFDKQKNPTGILKSEKPIEVLFEGADLSIFDSKIPVPEKLNNTLSHIKEEFNFLFVGHWLQGDIGHDRKDVGMLIKTFCETFAGSGKKPGLILKTSSATFSVIDREQMIEKIANVKKTIAKKHLPNIYLLHGDLSPEEMNGLYNHKKVKAHISFTKGEGYGRPLLEASLSGKPVIASGWSGHVDFLKEHSFMLPGAVNKVHQSASNEWIIDQSGWFTVDYEFASKTMKDIYKDYKRYVDKTRKQKQYSKTEFSLEKMNTKLAEIINTKMVKKMKLEMPTTLKLPKLKKV